MLLLALAGSCAAQPRDEAAQLLQEADAVKTSDHAKFLGDLARLDSLGDKLDPTQRSYVRYLHAWKDVYAGKYDVAIPQLNAVIDDSSDPALRLRASVTVINALTISGHYQESYARLSQVLDLLPQVSDMRARQQAFGVAALLYNRAGQYDLAIVYADKLINENWAGRGPCVGGQQKMQALYESGRLRTIDNQFQDVIDACGRIGEPGFANLVRTYVANIQLADGKVAQAIKLLQDNYADVRRMQYPALTSDFDSLLARAFWVSKDMAEAKDFAQKAIEDGVKNEVTEPLVNAYRVLYEVARQQGDFERALDWHEKFAAADKGYLNDASAHALAFQMVHQQVQEKKAQVAVLSQQNQVLKLKQDVNRKNMLAIQLGIALLLVVLGSIAMYAFRTKRSQLKFQKLARRDGLTEIHNRQYFVECAEAELAYCRKSVRDVSLVAIDLDHFKHINDSHGHAAGDFALKRAVAACQKHLRSVDIFGRLGGEEFGILMPDCVPERAADIAEKMRAEIASLQGSEGEPDFPVTASFGVTAARWSGYELLQLLAQADSALYQAKREGRNRVIVHGPATAASDGPLASAQERHRALT